MQSGNQEPHFGGVIVFASSDLLIWVTAPSLKGEAGRQSRKPRLAHSQSQTHNRNRSRT